MDVDPARYQSLLTAVEGLYTRLQGGALAATDVIPLQTLQTPSNADYLARVFADPALFEARFGTFKQAYDIFRVFRDDETVLDVGAHWGYSALSMRNQGCRALVVSIEAMAFHLPALERLKTLAGGRYDYVHVAASDAPRRLVFYVPVVNRKLVTGLSSTGGTLVPSLATIVARRAADFPPLAAGAPDEVAFAVVETDARPIDDIVASLGEAGERIAAIKMDVEGHEPEALRGARKLITSRRPVLMVEGGAQAPVVALMREYGYIRAARVEGRLVPWGAHAKQSDTYWYHPETLDELRSRGLVP